MLRIGLTGGIGSGKSTVSARLAELGAVVVDADKIAREVVEPGSPGLDMLAAEFGEDIVGADGAREVDATDIEAAARAVVERRSAEHEGGAR